MFFTVVFTVVHLLFSLSFLPLQHLLLLSSSPSSSWSSTSTFIVLIYHCNLSLLCDCISIVFHLSYVANTSITIVILLFSQLLLSLSSHQTAYVGVVILLTNIASVCVRMYLCDIIHLLISTDVPAASAFTATVLIPSRCLVHRLASCAYTRCICTALECFCPCYALAACFCSALNSGYCQ